MRLSFKYKFILSFVGIEIVFISLIVFFNFSSLNKLSRALIDEKVETATKLFTELIKIPLANNDITVLNNEVQNITNIKNIVAVEILDNNAKVLSHLHVDNHLYQILYSKKLQEIKIDGRTFRQTILPIYLDGKVIGSTKIVFEITDSLKTIEKNRDLTYFLVLLEVLFSIMISFIIGHKLWTRSLNLLASSAEQIAKNEQVVIPDIKSADEISVLSNALHFMQRQIAQRHETLKDLVKKLQKERDFHSALLDQASSIVLVMNNKGEIVLTNKTVEKLTGYTQAEVAHKIPWEIFIPKEQRKNVEKVFLSLVAGDFPSSYENFWIVKDGSYVPFAWSNSCIVDEKGEIEYVIAVGIDMTERNKINQTIKALLNSPLDSIVLISLDETILEINDIAAKRLNSTPNKLKGTKISDYISEDISLGRRKYINELIITKKPITFEEKQNGYIFKNHIYPILDNNGDVVQISIFSYDVTALQKAKKELNKYIKLVDENVMISHADLQGVTTSVSKAFCQMTGYSNEELIGQKYNILRVEDIPSSLYENLWNTIKRGKVWHGEIKNIAKDGHYYWVEASIYPDFDDHGDLIGFNAIRQDITNKKLIEEISITDALTKLYNRRYFDDIFEREINRARRDKKIFCLLSLDVDNFKLYNDTYGHQMGDNVLATIGRVLKGAMRRADDFAFRIGGEEFSAIYTVCDEKGVSEFANTIRKSIEDKKIEHKENTVSPYVTASFGVIFIDFSKSRNAVTDQSTLYNAADELLYRAKSQGRNMVIVEEN
jgi:diguanylate cyclase (GGDEF)-like protein/PAS domain S-box-containing protein